MKYHPIGSIDSVPFSFSIRAGIRKAWELYTLRPWFYSALAVIMAILNVPTHSTKSGHLIVDIAAAFISLVFSYMWLSILLTAVDKKEDLLHFGALSKHFPNFRQLLMLFVVALLAGLAVLGGFILLIIPGIYVLTKLAFAQFAYIDNQGAGVHALKYSWRIVTKDAFWTVLLSLVVVVALVIVGIAFFGIGFLVTYPIAMLFLAHLYRTLTERNAQIATPVIDKSKEV